MAASWEFTRRTIARPETMSLKVDEESSTSSTLTVCCLYAATTLVLRAAPATFRLRRVTSRRRRLVRIWSSMVASRVVARA